MSYGFHGKILHVDLTKGELEVERPLPEFYRAYLGGSAMATQYVLKHTPANADPLGPENTLALMVGVLTGTAISGQSRVAASAKSPLTDAIGDSQGGGFWPAELKFAGFDGIVIHGKSEKPVYLWIKDGEAELRDASHLWGELTGDVETAIQDEFDDKKIEVLQIGPAGEKMVKYAAMISMSNRANGRTGMGAVMGSKNLKAIAVRGKNRPAIADKDAFKKLAKWGPANIADTGVASMGKYGTPEVLMGQQKSGGLPTHNWSAGVFDGAEAISGETMHDTILTSNDTCYACTVRCKRVVQVTEGPFPADPHYGGPEYETLATFGAYCGVSDLNAIAHANQLCNQYGIDTISCGATLAWAFNAFEEEMLTLADTGGIALNWGNAEAMVKLVGMIGRREGFGDVLAEGSVRAAEKIGRGSEDLVVTGRKMEYPAHMPQVKRLLGLIYSVNPYGADHQASEHDGTIEGGFKSNSVRLAEIGFTEKQDRYSLTDEKVRFATVTEQLYSALNSVSVCQFVFGPSWHLYSTAQLVDVINATTGWDMTIEEFVMAGERSVNMQRAFNAREGLTRIDDTLPKKLTKGLTGGRSDGFNFTPEELEIAKDQYYAHAGWDVATGNPTREKLESLDLAWIAELSGE